MFSMTVYIFYRHFFLIGHSENCPNVKTFGYSLAPLILSGRGFKNFNINESINNVGILCIRRLKKLKIIKLNT